MRIRDIRKLGNLIQAASKLRQGIENLANELDGSDAGALGEAADYQEEVTLKLKDLMSYHANEAENGDG